ncbi:hypothetical protein LOTGIDRAFT_156526 [Lottia gigantea]|uniref:Sushi domain-containing protein n=1 Tax=Lottia gigantea TaxID=225164 RepID=V4B999_LOTGI|nr:hypothetical protein LOTGIDRAFT_156526 [Lottia gigantea]ESP03926.1 hypothetical protein LOTGIDRAFT_156526 [Lottia gigantea]
MAQYVYSIEFKCPIIDCGPRLPIPGAKYTAIPNTYVGQSFMFECMDQFTLLGSSDMDHENTTVVCDSTGRWRYGNLTCSGARCSDPGTPANAEQITDGYGIGQTINYRCMRPGYSPVPDVTLGCIAGTANDAKWNDTVPKCLDTMPPEFTDCPSSPIMVNPLEEITLTVPTATDNSGFVTVEYTVKSTKMWFLVDRNITYQAIDGEDNTVECIVQYKVKTVDPRPTLTCPTHLTLPVMVRSSQSINLVENITSNGDLTINPKTLQYDTSNINTFTQVTGTATGKQGQSSQCTFLVGVKADACLEETLVPLVNANRICGGNLEALNCKTTCKSGAYFKSGNSTSISSCTGSAVWSGSDANEDCLVSKVPVYSYSIKMIYEFGAPISSCKNSFRTKLQAELTKTDSRLNKACKKSLDVNYKLAVENLVAEQNSAAFEKADVSAVLRVLDTDIDQMKLTQCEDNLKTYSVEIFDFDNSDCGDSDIENFEIVKSGNSCSDEGYSLVTSDDSNVVCLPCGPGTFYNSTSKSCEDCLTGEYQDMANQKSCKKCVNAIESVSPRRLQSSCIENCPDGFYRIEGFCEACPVDQFKVDNVKCSPCPDGGSTLGVNGVNSKAGCKAPCQPGYYSTTGFEDCTACPRHFYSAAGAAKTCTECAKNQITTEMASISNENCTQCFNNTITLPLPVPRT